MKLENKGQDSRHPRPAPEISVIIVNFNAGDLLHQTVTAALASTLSVEVIISDNGSTDGSLNAIYKAYGSNPRVQIISNGANLGFSRANNIAMNQAQGRYVLLLNPDCIVQPDTLAKMVSIMDAHPDVGMAGCLIRNPDGSEQPGCRRAVPTPWRSLVRVLHLHKLFPEHPRFRTFLLHQEPLPREHIPVEAISGAFMLVRRDAMDKVGLMDEDYFLHCEDIDWCMRFRQAGWTILFEPNVEVIHHKGTCSQGRPIRVLYHMHRGMIRFYRKFFRRQYPLPLMVIVMATVWARFLLLASIESLKLPFRRPAPAIPPLQSTAAMNERRNAAAEVIYIGHERRRKVAGARSASSEQTHNSN